MKKSSILLVVATLLFGCKDEPLMTQNTNNWENVEPVNLKLDTVLTGLQSPWGLEFVGDNILITEKNGLLMLWDGSTLTQVKGLPTITPVGQGGLLDVIKHPDFSSNNLIYFCGSAGTGNNVSTTLFRGKLVGDQLTEVQQLFQANPSNSSGAHFGSRITFDAQNHVYLSLGDRGSMETAQQLNNHNGSVIRLNNDGSIPSDNPFVGNANAKDEIWTYGHRNVQGMATHPATGEIWTHEHGPKGGDEINVLAKGANYGWPLASFGINYNGQTITKDTFVPGTVLPVYYWVPSIAPCGMNFYTSDSIPQWKGSLFLGALAGKHINRLEIEGNKVVKEERLLQDLARFRAVKEGPDGYLYMLCEQPGMLLRFRPKH